MISIIIPAYNEENYLEKTFASLHNQTNQDFETIVVANGCTDNTIAIARKHADKILKIKERGTSLARNVGAMYASTDTLLFLDADTRLLPNAIEEIKKQFNKKDAVAVLKSEPNASRFLYNILHFMKNMIHSMRIYSGSSGVIIVPKALFLNVKGFKEKHISENHELIKNLRFFGDYKVISNTGAITSARRYEKWGLLKTTYFWLMNKWFFPSDATYEAIR